MFTSWKLTLFGCLRNQNCIGICGGGEGMVRTKPLFPLVLNSLPYLLLVGACHITNIIRHYINVISLSYHLLSFLSSNMFLLSLLFHEQYPNICQKKSVSDYSNLIKFYRKLHDLFLNYFALFTKSTRWTDIWGISVWRHNHIHRRSWF